MDQLLVPAMLRRFLLGGFALTALAGTGAVAQEVGETKAGSGTFDYSPLTVQDEIAQAQPIASEEKAPGVVAAETQQDRIKPLWRKRHKIPSPA